MKLNEILKGVRGWKLVNGRADADVRGIEDSSANVKKGSLFICLKGFRSDGHSFAADAARRGASVIVAEKPVRVKDGAAVVKVKDTRKALSEIAGVFYREQLKKTRVYGITGTNGKTTVSYLISEMLKNGTGKNNTVIGTIKYKVGKKVYGAVTTTPSSVTANNLIKETAANKMKDVVMEISSHALDQGRTDNIRLKAAVITNITRDHLDYHGTFARYLGAKMKIMNRLERGGALVVNVDSAGSGKIIAEARRKKIKVITFSAVKEADIYLVSSEFSIKGTRFTLSIRGKKHRFETGLIGEHNIYNIMSAIGAAMNKVKMSSIKKTVKNFRAVKGRLEKIYEGDFTVFVDYAHTPDSLEKVLESLNRVKEGRIILVFGAGGDRDKGKRPLMGKVAEKLSCVRLLTSDNPRFENPEKIINDVLSGVKNRNNIIVEPDRERAIRCGIRMARKGDIVLIAGKGHEAYQEISGKKFSFDDAKKAASAVRDHGTKLYEILSGVKGKKVMKGSDDVYVESVEESSKNVKKGSVFVCVKGFNTDGHRYAGEAVKKGAAAVVASKKIRLRGSTAALVVVKDTKEAMLRMADVFYGRDREKAVITGVTGTNGKSTVSHLIGGILKVATGNNNAVLGTINYRIGEKIYAAPNTTPSNITIHKLISEAVRSGIKDVVMEVSSHALDQDRVKNIRFNTAVITNITRDHLDYHKDFRSYTAAKEKIAYMLAAGGKLVVNADDKSGKRIKGKKLPKGIKVITTGIKNRADFKALKIKDGKEGVSFVCAKGGERIRFKSSLVGKHNVYNVLAAVAAVYEKVKKKDIKKAVKKFKTLPGRLEKIYSNGITVYIDFAHTPDGLERVIKALNKIKKNKLITVFGTAGNRDKGKRPLMGAIAGTYSDEVIITSDNPRYENPVSIIKAITAGIKRGRFFYVEPDRKKAIQLGIMNARRGDIVLITGKGHQNYQEIMGKKVVFDDKRVALSALKRKKWNYI